MLAQAEKVVSVRNQRMYALRLERGLTQEQVAEAVGITQSAYAMIEGGHRYPRKQIAKRLADFFGVTVDELFFAEDNHAAQWKTGASTPRDCRKAYAGHRTR
jgi:transcriptional regulator with XRE-family HTH domain